MRKIIAYIACAAVMLASVGLAYTGKVSAASGKQLYADFSAELQADKAVSSGNGENTVTLYSGYMVGGQQIQNSENLFAGLSQR